MYHFDMWGSSSIINSIDSISTRLTSSSLVGKPNQTKTFKFDHPMSLFIKAMNSVVARSRGCSTTGGLGALIVRDFDHIIKEQLFLVSLLFFDRSYVK